MILPTLDLEFPVSFSSFTHFGILVGLVGLSLGLAGCDLGGSTSSPPEISSVDPTSAQPGTEITIRGSNFGSDPSAVTVSFAGTTAPIQNLSSSEIETQVPEDATDGPVKVAMGQKAATGPEFDVIPRGRIAFDRNTDSGSNEIYTMKPDGSDLKQVTDDTNDKTDPDWSPDGSQIVYQVWSGDIGVYTINLGSSNPTLVTNNTGNGAPSWSPDGSLIAFKAPDGYEDNDIRTIQPDGSNSSPVTSTAAIDAAPDWSPQNSRIVFHSDRSDNHEIYTINPDGTTLQQVTNNSAYDYEPVWSPKGSRIAFASDRNGNFEIYTVKPDGSDLIQVTDNSSDEFQPTWSPDGSRIAFVSDRTGGHEIYTIGKEGSDLKRLTNNSMDDESPAWGMPSPQE